MIVHTDGDIKNNNVNNLQINCYLCDLITNCYLAGVD